MNGQWLSRCLSCLSVLALSLGTPASWAGSETDYWALRGRILADESRSSLGGKLEFEYGERAANDVLMAAKQEEIDRGFRYPSTFLPARNFMTVIEGIQRSSTFKIIQGMPKGAVLHAHDTAITSSEFVYENITFRENLHVCRREDGSIGFRFLRSPDNDTSCDSPTGWELLADLRLNETIAEEVNNQIRSALTMVVPDPAAAYPDVDTAWVSFLGIFIRIEPLLTYLPVFADYYYQGLTELREDNVLYLELRSLLPTLYDLDGNTYGPLDVARVYKTTTDRYTINKSDSRIPRKNAFFSALELDPKKQSAL